MEEVEPGMPARTSALPWVTHQEIDTIMTEIRLLQGQVKRLSQEIETIRGTSSHVHSPNTTDDSANDTDREIFQNLSEAIVENAILSNSHLRTQRAHLMVP